MIDSSNLLICSCSSGIQDDPVRLNLMKSMLNSSAKHGVNVQIYWTNKPFDDYFSVKIKNLYDRLNEATGYTHVLYVDCHDIIFTSGIDEILTAYDSLGDPNFLISADFYYGLKNEDVDLTRTGYCVPNEGCFIGEINTIKNVLQRIIENVRDGVRINPHNIIRRLLRSGIINQSNMDIDCVIFQSIKNSSYLDIGINNGRIYNESTSTYPKILHSDNSMHHPLFNDIQDFTVNDKPISNFDRSCVVKITGSPDVANVTSDTHMLKYDLGSVKANILLSRSHILKMITKSIDLVNVRYTDSSPLLRVWFIRSGTNAQVNIRNQGVLESFILSGTSPGIGIRFVLQYDTALDKITEMSLIFVDVNKNILHTSTLTVDLDISLDSIYFSKYKDTLITP